MHLKGTVRQDFIRPPLFSSIEPALATGQWIKVFFILIRFSQSYSHFSEISPGYDTLAIQSPQSMIPRRVNIPGVASQLLKFLLNSTQGMIPRGVSFFKTKI